MSTLASVRSYVAVRAYYARRKGQAVQHARLVRLPATWVLAPPLVLHLCGGGHAGSRSSNRFAYAMFSG